MIEAKNITKCYDNIKALEDVSASISDAQVFGLIGTNGAGKSTFLRTLSGVLKPDVGQILVDGEDVYENPDKKKDLFYISDEQYFLPNANPIDMCSFYMDYYENFNKERFLEMLDKFGLDGKRKINTYSKGMKKQVSVILGVCAGTKYLLCDETFDGLDPVMRQAVKSLFAAEIEDRGLTPIIASHNLRELEDICDHVGLLHKGGILFSKDLDELKCNIHKIQAVFASDDDAKKIISELEVMKQEKRGSLYTLTIRGDFENIDKKIKELNPVFAEILPLSLEEIFISETEVKGYDIKSIIF